MNEYYLFLDESTTHSNYSNIVFCIAGIIVNKSDYDNIVKPKLNELKMDIWSDLPNPTNIIIHQKVVREAKNCNVVPPEYRRFKSNSVCKQLYDGLKAIFDLNILTVVGSSIVMDNLNSYFHKDILSDEYLIGMQIVLENYSHFLHKNNGSGLVFYESREEHQDKKIRMRYNLIKAMGSMYVNSYAMQRLLKDIEFPAKSDNIEGLQIADFVPNDFARLAAGSKKQKFNLYDVTRIYRYNGGISSKENRFGVKIMP